MRNRFLMACCTLLIALAFSEAAKALTPSTYIAVVAFDLQKGEADFDDVSRVKLLRLVEHLDDMADPVLIVITMGDEVASDENRDTQWALARVRANTVRKLYEENLGHPPLIEIYPQEIKTEQILKKNFSVAVILRGFCKSDYKTCQKYWPDIKQGKFEK